MKTHTRLLLPLLLPFGAIAQQGRSPADPKYFTGRVPNGSLWNTMEESGRQLYIGGFVDALGAVCDDQNDSCKAMDFRPLNVGEIVGRVSTLYSLDRANVSIPIQAILYLVSLQVHGTKTDEIDRILSRFRTAYSQDKH